MRAEHDVFHVRWFRREKFSVVQVQNGNATYYSVTDVVIPRYTAALRLHHDYPL